MKSCSQLLTVETVEVMLIIHCQAPCLFFLHEHWFDDDLIQFFLEMFSDLIFSEPNVVQVMWCFCRELFSGYYVFLITYK